MKRFIATGLFLFSLAFGLTGCSAIGSETLTGATTGTGTGSSTGMGDSGSTGGVTNVKSGQLTAVEWNDNAHWRFFKNLLVDTNYNQYPVYWGLPVDYRISIAAVSGTLAAADASVKLKTSSGSTICQTRTDNKGRAVLFYKQSDIPNQPFTMTIASGTASTDILAVLDNDTNILTVDLTGVSVPAKTLDLMVVIDTTGSMGDELTYLKAEILNVIQRVKLSNSGITVRISCNYYRDEGDEYVVRDYEFTESVETVISQMNIQQAKDGGDYEEAVHTAMENAITGEKHVWSASATARICFLVLDAPPHYNTDVVGSISKIADNAASKGIRIVPVVCSGANKSLEFLMRLWAIRSGGTCVYLTDASGIGGSHLTPTIGEAPTELLNDLMVRVIGEYLK